MDRRYLAAIAGTAIVLAAVFAWADRSGEGPRGPDVPPHVLRGLVEGSRPGPVAPGMHTEVRGLEARLEDAPADTAALRRLATLLQDGHRAVEAVPYWRRLVTIDPEDRQAWLDLAVCAAAARDWAEAEDASRSLLARRPGDLEAMYNLGAVRATVGDPVEARRWWTKVADQDADPALAHRALESLARLEGISTRIPAGR